MPTQVQPRNFSDFELITHANIDDILNKVKSGEREPLNHVALPYTSYLELAKWMEDVEVWIKQASKKLDRWSEEYEKSLSDK